MSDPLNARGDLDKVLELVLQEAQRYLGSLDDMPVRWPNAAQAAQRFREDLPEEGSGTLEAITTLLQDGLDAAVNSAGPRFFHFVIGGQTPAALAADWLTSTLDQNPGLWVATPLASDLEVVTIDWLKQLFGLPASWEGVLTSGATMANFVGLAAARRWWAGRHGVDAEEQGLVGLPQMPVFSSGYLHASAVKALAMLGLGRSSVTRFTLDPVGRLDLDAMAAALAALDGAPAVLVANAGEVNAGDFDPIFSMAELAEEYNCWLHVDGAFGLFARLSPAHAALVAGVERANSVTSDGHKWLNVPYDAGFAFVREPGTLLSLFSQQAAYLTDADDPKPNFGFMGPESSRRARAITVWATLKAYGRSGYRDMVERHLGLAQRVAERVDGSNKLERLADVPLNIVCFRWHPPGLDDEAKLNDLNARLGEAVLADGRVYVGTTDYGGKTAFRPAIVNWRTTEADVDLLVDVLLELGTRLA